MQQPTSDQHEKGLIHWPILLGLAQTKLLIHFTTNTNYGLHRDEYLYLN